MEELPIEKFFGVGKVTAAKMKSIGLHTGADLKKLTEAELKKQDDREAQPHRETKSIGAEDTFPYDLTSPEDMYDELLKITKTVYNRLLQHGIKGRTLTLKIKYHDFKVITRSHSFLTASTTGRLYLEPHVICWRLLT